MKWLLLVIGLFVLVGAGWWYYEKNWPVVTQINRQEAGVSKSYTHEYRGTFVSLDEATRMLKPVRHRSLNPQKIDRISQRAGT